MISPTPEDEAALEATKAPLMEHLLELRSRLIWALVSFGICFALCFAFSKQIMMFLTEPLHHQLAGKTNDITLQAEDILYVPTSLKKDFALKTLEALAGSGITSVIYRVP